MNRYLNIIVWKDIELRINIAQISLNCIIICTNILYPSHIPEQERSNYNLSKQFRISNYFTKNPEIAHSAALYILYDRFLVQPCKNGLFHPIGTVGNIWNTYHYVVRQVVQIATIIDFVIIINVVICIHYWNGSRQNFGTNLDLLSMIHLYETGR